MLPKLHFIITALFVLILTAFGITSVFQALIIFAAAFFIDVDHWFVAVHKKKSLSIKKAYDWLYYTFYKPNVKRKFFYIFHTIESYVLIALLALRFEFFFYVFIGMVLHMVLDIIDDYHKGFCGREISLICALFKHFRK